MPQELAVYPLLTARENLDAFGRLQGLSGADARPAGRLGARARPALADRANEPVKQFSGGMRRRLNIACGVLHRPRVVLLDEPTVGVDPQSRDRIYDMLAELAREGVSLLLTTHHLEEAEARCSRTVIIDHGQASSRPARCRSSSIGRSDGTGSSPCGSTVRCASLAAGDARLTSTSDHPRVLRARMPDVASELPPLLRASGAPGGAVDDVEVRGPSLQSVFIHLTGRELRE